MCLFLLSLSLSISASLGQLLSLSYFLAVCLSLDLTACWKEMNISAGRETKASIFCVCVCSAVHTQTPDVDLDSIFKRLFFCCFYFKIKSQLSETFSWTKRSFLEAIKFARSRLIWQTVFKYCSRFNSGFRRQFPRHRQRGSWGATEQRMTTARLFVFVLWRISLI